MHLHPLVDVECWLPSNVLRCCHLADHSTPCSVASRPIEAARVRWTPFGAILPTAHPSAAICLFTASAAELFSRWIWHVHTSGNLCVLVPSGAHTCLQLHRADPTYSPKGQAAGKGTNRAHSALFQ